MKKNTFLSLILFLLFVRPILSKDNFSKNWELTQKMKRVIVYSARNVEDVYATKVESKPTQYQLFQKYKENEIIKKVIFETTRRLGVFGLKNYTVKTKKIKKVNKKYIVFLTGSYVDLSGSKIKFVEKNYYTSKITLNLLYTQPYYPKKKISKELAQSFFNHYSKVK